MHSTPQRPAPRHTTPPIIHKPMTKLTGTAIEPDPPEAPIDPKPVDERNADTADSS